MNDNLSPHQFKVSDLMNAWSGEYDSPVHGVADDLNQERLRTYSRLTALTPPPVHVAMPVPGEEPEPTLLDGHHRVHAAHRMGRETIPGYAHQPVKDEHGDVDYPTYYDERWG
jgi:hypothetical protein